MEIVAEGARPLEGILYVTLLIHHYVTTLKTVLSIRVKKDLPLPVKTKTKVKFALPVYTAIPRICPAS